MELLASTASWGLFACGALILIFMLTRRSRRYLRQSKRESRQPHQHLAAANRDQALVDAPVEVLRWQVEMHETARDLKAELDSKMVALQTLTRFADEAAERMEAAINRAESLGLAPGRDTLAEIAACAEANTLDTLPRAPDNQDLHRLHSQRDTVHALAAQGLTSGAIAEQIGAAIGDVELLLSLKTQ